MRRLIRNYALFSAPSPAKRKFTAKLAAARKELLDLGLRNALLNYRLLKARGLDVVDELPEQLFRLLVTEGKTLSFLPAPDKVDNSDGLPQAEDVGTAGLPAARHLDSRLQTAVSSKELQARLLKTYYTARTFIEEQDVNTLFLALGMLNWYEDDSSSESRRAPLILVPVTLERANVQERFHISYSGEDTGDNLSLIAKLQADFGILLPLLPETTDEIDVLAYFRAVELPRLDTATMDSWNLTEASRQPPPHIA